MSDFWINDDGLLVRFGTRRAEQGKVGHYRSHGPRRFEEVHLFNLPSTDDGTQVWSHDVRLPEGAMIESYTLVLTEDFAGDNTPELSVGIAPVEDPDGVPFNTEHVSADDDFIIATATVANLNAGAAAQAGDGVGDPDERVPYPAVITVTTTEANGAWTAGEATLRIRWSVPVENEDTLVQD